MARDGAMLAIVIFVHDVVKSGKSRKFQHGIRALQERGLRVKDVLAE